MQASRVYADFNGLFGDLLCLSHSETAPDETGNEVQLIAGMVVTAFQDDPDANGCADNLIAHGVVEKSPDWLKCKGSRWVLRIDKRGVYHESELPTAALETIHVLLPDEVVEVWRPVQARHLGADRYQVVSVNNDPETERWEFNAGDVVRCRCQKLSEGATLVAYEFVQGSA